MGKALVITEKPSVAQEFARVLGVSGRRNGYIENDRYVVTWCVGHLVEMVYPEKYDEKYKKWRVEDLPFLPQEYKYDVIENVRDQYNIVHGCLHREDIDTVYWAGDAGKEGQTIEENIRNFGGVREGMKELRVWIDSQTEEEIQRGIREAKPMEAYANLGKSGIMRSIEDYAMGINFSRAMSVKYGNLLNDAAGTAKYTAIAVGRVMTCVLGMVVIREREIRNFVEIPFYRVVGRFSPEQSDTIALAEWKSVEDSKYFESPLLYKENGFKKKESAEALIQELTGENAFVESIEKGISKKKAPLLFNLAELQAECSKRFKISPDETLQAAQDLYEKKLTTYPRTDARVLSTAVAKEIDKNISRLRNYTPVKTFAENIMKLGLYRNIAKTQYTDDSKVTDHYAIIPTGQLTELNSLSELQRSVYDLIVRRFLSIFYPAAEYQTVRLIVKVGRERLFAGTRVLKSKGYLEISGKPQKDTDEDGSEEGQEQDNSRGLLQLADQLKNGDPLHTQGYELKEGKTNPPKRYTSGSMVLAMENAGQLIEDEELRAQIKGSGIGTSATRAEIIKKLIRIGYLNLNKKTQILTPENLGEMVFEVVHMSVPILLNPQMTASWEKGLEGITQGTVNLTDYREKLEDFIRRETNQMVQQDLTLQVAAQISQFAGKNGKGIGAKRRIGVKCPVCGGEIETTPFGYGCSNYKKDGTGCHFAVGTIAGKELDEKDVRSLLETGHTDILDGFLSKSKKKFSAKLTLTKEEDGKCNIAFDFSENRPEILKDAICPNCGGRMTKAPFGYVCENHKRDVEGSCPFSIGKIADKSLNDAQLKELLTNRVTSTIRGFKGKNGKKFDACLCLAPDENGVIQVRFDFEHVEAKKIKDVVCPLCGGDIVQTPFGYGCANYSKDNPESCRFSIGKMAEKALTEAQVKELLTQGRTSTIRGFKSKNGKKFDARIAIARDEANKITGLKFDFEDLEQPKLKDVRCPVCGGDIVQTPFGYGCANYSRDNPESCRFSIGKIAGVKLKDAQVKELLQNKRTKEEITGFVSKSGTPFNARLKVTPEGQIAFDFPEKPKPVETTLKCPKCGRPLMKTEWYYECECGYKIGHTVAKVFITEELMTQLFTKGRTDQKITGFTSKAGNQFDTVLKYEEDRIAFDFEAEEIGASAGTEMTGDTESKQTETHENPPSGEPATEAAGKEDIPITNLPSDDHSAEGFADLSMYQEEDDESMILSTDDINGLFE